MVDSETIWLTTIPPERRTAKRPTAPSLLPIRLSWIMLLSCPRCDFQEYFYGRSTQAARTESRNLPPSLLRRLESPDSVCAAESTCEDADPVSLAPRCTAVMLAAPCCVPSPACCR